MSDATPRPEREDVAFTCHGGLLAGEGLPNSLEVIQRCLEANAFRVEIDVHSMADGEYLVSHASRLEESTTARGAVGALTRDAALKLRRTDAPDLRPPVLSEVVNLAVAYDAQLQLDLKDWRPLSSNCIDTLLSITEPLGQRAIVSSGQDWNLRTIHRRGGALRLGFDPDHYLASSGARGVPVPSGLGAYGYRDDHPLALGRSQAVAGYLRERVEALVSQCPFVSEFFVEKSLLLQAFDDGVAMGDILHEFGISLTAWTLDYDGDESLAVLAALRDCGVDHVTTNTSQQFAAALAVA